MAQEQSRPDTRQTIGGGTHEKYLADAVDSLTFCSLQPISHFYSIVTQLVPFVLQRGITTNFEDFMKQERQLLDIVKSRTGFNVDVNDRRFNHVHLPPLRVDANHLWINLIAALSPSPDWFTGFYLFEPFDEISRHFWDQFVLHLYPWDAGTDEGDSYMSVDLPLDPQLPVARFTTTMAKQRSNAFLSPDGATIPHVAEFQCKFWVCGINDDPDGENCNMPDWPPANGCDVLRYPGCERQCTMDQPGCQECKNGEFYFSCCESLTEPMNGDCTSSGTVWRVMGATLVSLVSLWTLLW